MFEAFKIALLSPRHKNDGEYCISDILKITEGKNSHNVPAWIYTCKNNKKYNDNLFGESENMITDKKVIYFEGYKYFGHNHFLT